jgi:2,3,4,5-tetrahydropyridine-2-carboxylate N-succinyltransferase
VKSSLQNAIEQLYGSPAVELDRTKARAAVLELRRLLNSGQVRAAEFRDLRWIVNEWVKKGILLAFRAGRLKKAGGTARSQFFDKDTMDLRRVSGKQNLRIVPGGSAVRDGAYVAPGVVMMPPSYVNIGAYIDADTLVDSHALVGSCAQIGKRVHLSAGAQIGGVLEPIGTLPVIIEDDVFVGGNTGIYEGAIVGRRAVIASGVILTGSTPVYDIVRNAVYRRSGSGPLTIPEGAVVVAGNRHIDQPFAHAHKLSIYTPVIVKYRDEKTAASVVLEDDLR